jgi:hypothetical protein
MRVRHDGKDVIILLGDGKYAKWMYEGGSSFNGSKIQITLF